ncbi:alpha/beta fold hydrolase [Flagellimonas hymeniacidonis]|nr:alpha/beta hydrolase [Flagellimonas hymeniacidonis]
MKFLVLITMTLISGQNFGQSHKKTEIININGINMYFEVHGEGEPLFLLHGWTQSSQFWSEYIPTYAQHFKVYAIDLRGHGKSSELTDDFSIEKTASDILKLLDFLKIEKAKAVGLSYGGLTLLKLASLHPERIESMVLIGVAPIYDGKENTNLDKTFSYENLPDSFIKELKETHYGGESQIKRLFDQNLNYRISIGDETLKSIKTKVLIVNGDRDEIMGIDPAITLHKFLPNSELWIVPNTGHIAITGSNRYVFLTKSTQFLQNGER